MWRAAARHRAALRDVSAATAAAFGAPLLARQRPPKVPARGSSAAQLRVARAWMCTSAKPRAADGNDRKDAVDDAQSPPREAPSSSESLSEHLRQRIRFRNAMTIAEFMRECVTNPQHGYYMRRTALGAEGDFTTAPEISQVFGDCIGAWVVHRFASFQLIELGPGFGTLMADILRAVTKITPQLVPVLDVDLVEASPGMRERQQEKLEPAMKRGVRVRWYKSVDEVPSGKKDAFIYIAQEFFDALAVHQFQRTERGWCERMIDVDDTPDAEFPFRYVLSPGPTAASTLLSHLLPPPASGVREIELSADAVAVAESMGARIASSDGLGTALIADYGRDGPQAATVRAIRGHTIEPVLAHPGLADLSADVDFSALRAAFLRGAHRRATAAELRPRKSAKGASRNASSAEAADVLVQGPVYQRDFLSQAGAADRLRVLLDVAAGRDPDGRERAHLRRSYERLVLPEHMGTIYKVMTVSHPSAPPPAAMSATPSTAEGGETTS